MTTDPRRDLDAVRESARQLVHDVELLNDDTLREPSLLPGWTRAHVVSHLIGNAAGLTNLIEWARTSQVRLQYDDQQARDASVQAYIGQPAGALADRLREATDAFVAAATRLTDQQWQASVRLGAGGTGRELEAAELPWRRLVEQEVHNVDLAAAYTPAHWSPEFVHRLLDEVARFYLTQWDVPALHLNAVDGDWAARSARDGDATLVEGPSPALLAWLTGRSAGEGLHVSPGPLPDLPPWY